MQDLSHIPIFVKQSDYQALTEFIRRNRSDAAKDLQSEVDRADIVEDCDYNNDFVCIDSVVTFMDLDALTLTKVTLVMPWQANVTLLKVSVLSPVGCALLGLQKGSEIEWDDVYQSAEARKICLRAEVEMALHFKNIEKRLQW
ncbi:MAG: GreA/GreB family elongation factor, partial [Gammaproteobacteria bacterium]|nr:GreA/GreB family elongation factor [Gammaproteobacteria bacterium]MBU1834309.1 GreA/GreB family elongation factor [Gammaproteobacteria bacterium]